MFREERNVNVNIIRWICHPFRSLRATTARRDFNRMMQGYDDSIALARSKHHPVSALLQAKTRFLHACLANDNQQMQSLFRHPQNWRGVR